MRFLLSLFCVLTYCLTSVTAQNIPAFPIGDQWLFPDARTLGMGGAGAVSNTGVAALMMNPASLAKNSEGLHLQFSPLARSLEERRSFEVYDRFESFLTNGIYVVNANWFNQIQGGVQYQVSGVPGLKSVAIGAFTEYDQNYEYEEEVRENDFELEQDPFAYNLIKFSGQTMRFSFGAAFEIMQKLHFGVQAGVLRGNLDQETSILFVRDSEADIRLAEQRELDNMPIAASLGAVYQVDPYFAIGGHLQLPYKMEYNTTPNSFGAGDYAVFSESIEYPMEANVGLEFRGRQSLQARLNIDLSYEWWSQAEYLTGSEVTRDNFEDAVQVKIGIEHAFFHQVPFYVGLQYRTTYETQNNTRFMFTGGSGFTGNGWRVDLAAGFSKQEYRARDLFDDSIFGGDRSATPIDDVQEDYFFGMATFRVDLGL